MPPTSEKLRGHIGLGLSLRLSVTHWQLRNSRIAYARILKLYIYGMYMKNKGTRIFSSPEHEVLMVSYCDQSLSVVRASSTFCFKQLLLQNGETDFEIILQEGSLGDPLPKLLKPFRSVEQDGRQS